MIRRLDHVSQSVSFSWNFIFLVVMFLRKRNGFRVWRIRVHTQEILTEKDVSERTPADSPQDFLSHEEEEEGSLLDLRCKA